MNSYIDTFLPPIENLQDPFMKRAYDITHQQFGKVLTPMKVAYARMSPEFLQFALKVDELDKMLTLPQEIITLIRAHVAKINVCLFCIDMKHFVTIQASMNKAKFDALSQYRTSSHFTDAERAALDYVTELTKHKKVNHDTFANMAKYYSELEICEIVWLVASEHFYNMTNIGLNIHSDMLCDINRDKLD
jgi:alkylhydroperoxidase family enzyme